MLVARHDDDEFQRYLDELNIAVKHMLNAKEIIWEKINASFNVHLFLDNCNWKCRDLFMFIRLLVCFGFMAYQTLQVILSQIHFYSYNNSPPIGSYL